MNIIDCSKWEVVEEEPPKAREPIVEEFVEIDYKWRNGLIAIGETKEELILEYEVLNIDSVKDIPKDYYGPMGVPITFLDNYRQDQFDLIELSRPTINNKVKYARIIIERKYKVGGKWEVNKVKGKYSCVYKIPLDNVMKQEVNRFEKNRLVVIYVKDLTI